VAHLNPLRREDLPQYEEMFATMEQRAGFVPNAFPTMARRPGMLDALQVLIQQVFAGSVSRETKSLVALMSSYGAGCRYCQAHQATSLMHQGIGEDKLADVADFERSDKFTEAERAAMRLAFASGQSPNAVTPGHFDDVRRFYDDGEIVEIVGVIAMFGFLNRWHETMATELEGAPSDVASQVLGGLAWEPGRHAGG
jgi:uncharacterized peroxidase-related enzyme